MNTILLIDTTGAVCQTGVAVMQPTLQSHQSRPQAANGCRPCLQSETRVCIPKAHAKMLPVLAALSLKHAGCDVPDAVAVTVGPGSFTGVRVGVAFAQGYAQAHGLPMVGVNTLAALAACYVREGELTVPVAAWIDARADRLYAQHYAPGKLLWHQPGAAMKVEEALADLQRQHPEGPIWFAGDGAAAHAGEILAALGSRPQLPPSAGAQVQLSAMAGLVFAMIGAGEDRPFDEITPYYL